LTVNGINPRENDKALRLRGTLAALLCSRVCHDLISPTGGTAHRWRTVQLRCTELRAIVTRRTRITFAPYWRPMH